MSIVTLITDYGTRDHYVGVLKGVMLGMVPDLRIVDITHEVEPHDIRHAAFVLRQTWPWYPPGTIHLCIVDPGVGSDRQIIVGRYAGRYVVAPDNGLLTFVHGDVPVEAMHIVENHHFFSNEQSATFHGRDIMAPVAAHLARGVCAEEFGRVTDRIHLLPVTYRANSAADGLSGEVLHVDRFGTMVTNVWQEQVLALDEQRGGREVHVNGVSIGRVRLTFSDVPAGIPIAVIGGSGLLEIAVNRGSAVDRFGPPESVRIEVR